jgi:hypothetical protein
MKHILNDMSEQEKNSIREQHSGGMKVMTENFSKLINSKLGDSKPLLEEENMEMSDEKEFFKFEGKSMETIQKLISQLPRTTKFLAITNSEGVDFSEMDLCNDFPGLVVVSLKNTPNNIKETNGDCVELLVKEENLYVVNKNIK